MADRTQGPGLGSKGLTKSRDIASGSALNKGISAGERESAREASADGALWSIRAAGVKHRKSAGLDVLLTKAAVEFQHLDEASDADLKRHCETLREALG